MSAAAMRGDPARPLYYGIMFVLMTVLFWKDTPIASWL